MTTELEILADDIVKTIEEEDLYYDSIKKDGFKQIIKAKDFLKKYWR